MNEREGQKKVISASETEERVTFVQAVEILMDISWLIALAVRGV